MTTEEIRQRVIASLTAAAQDAATKAGDRMWQNGPYNVQRWVERGFNAALNVVRNAAPEDGEAPGHYLKRIGAAAMERHGDGPDQDDEGWFNGAIEQACSIIANSDQ